MSALGSDMSVRPPSLKGGTADTDTDNSTVYRPWRCGPVRGRTLVQPVTRESAEVKGKRYLTEGRLIVELAQPGYLRATVRGAGEIYCVTFGRGGWHCTCPAWGLCAHLVAAHRIAAPIGRP